MTQQIQFRKSNVFLEEVTPSFSYENIHESLKLLLRGTERKSTEYVDEYFELIRLPYIKVSVAQLEKIIPDFDKAAKYPLFDPHQTAFFMMDHQIWIGIQKIVENLLKDVFTQEGDLNGKLKKITGISKDYDCLSDLFAKKLLFANIF